MMPDTDINQNHDSPLSTVQVHHQDILQAKSQPLSPGPSVNHSFSISCYFLISLQVHLIFFKSSFSAWNAKILWLSG